MAALTSFTSTLTDPDTPTTGAVSASAPATPAPTLTSTPPRPATSVEQARRVMVVAAHRTLREAVCRALREQGLTVCPDAPPGREALVAALGSAPHVVLVDVSTDENPGLDTCRQFRKAAVNTHVVALAPRLGNARHAALAAGADGVVTADVSLADLATFLGDVASRRSPRAAVRRPRAREHGALSAREHEVLTLAAGDLTDTQIANALVISVKTVKNHLRSVYAKLGTRSRTGAVVVAARQGLITL